MPMISMIPAATTLLRVILEQQQPGPADQGVRDQHPLLLAAGQVADPLVAEQPGADGLQHLVDQVPAPARRQRDAEPVPVQAQPDQVPGAQRHVGVQQDLLRHVADRRGAAGAIRAVDAHGAR
jgi:hypothetical protein